MVNLNYKNVNVLLIDPDHAYRQGILGMLRLIGITNITQGATLEEIKEYFKTATPDLLISETDLPDGNFCSFIYGVRHNIFGENPFASILAMTGKPSGDLVRKVIDSGADDLLTKPLSGKQIETRIITLIESRKPFVVTSDYIGPTRRNEAERSGSDVPLLDVPNLLRDKATGAATAAQTQAAIDSAILEINLHKLERYAFQIGFLIDNIVPKLIDKTVDKTTEQYILRLNYIAQDTARRMVGTKYSHVSELCNSLLKVVKDIRTADGSPTEKEISLLKPLSAAIQKGFASGTEDAAREIASSISQN